MCLTNFIRDSVLYWICGFDMSDDMSLLYKFFQSSTVFHLAWKLQF